MLADLEMLANKFEPGARKPLDGVGEWKNYNIPELLG
jgi:hypothetical protein